MNFMCLTGLNGWVFVFEISGCGIEIDSCCSHLNFRYCACFEQWAPVCPFTLKRGCDMNDKKNTQLKNFLPLYSVLLIYSKVKASQIIHGGTTPFAPSKNWIKAIFIHLIRKTFPVFHIYSVVKNHKKNHAYLTNSRKRNYRLLKKYSRLQHLSLSGHL